MVQRRQLAALAFAAHPRVLAWIPFARTVEQEEQVVALRRIARIEAFHLTHRILQQRVVARQYLLVGIQEVGQ
jgi:hypothetical protein